MPRRPTRRPRVEKVQHVVEIESWKFDYMFGIDDTSFQRGPYYDMRHLQLHGSIIAPAGLKAAKGDVTCFPTESLVGASSARIPENIMPVGSLMYRGQAYAAYLYFPSDILPVILQMLAAGKYRYIIFEAAPGGQEAAIYYFRFAETFGDEDIASNSDDV
jgi:hypothetical protein